MIRQQRLNAPFVTAGEGLVRLAPTSALLSSANVGPANGLQRERATASPNPAAPDQQTPRGDSSLLPVHRSQRLPGPSTFGKVTSMTIVHRVSDAPIARQVAHSAEEISSLIAKQVFAVRQGERDPDRTTGRPGSIIAVLPASIFASHGGRQLPRAIRLVDAIGDDASKSEEVRLFASRPVYDLIYIVRDGYVLEDAALLDADVDKRFEAERSLPALPTRSADNGMEFRSEYFGSGYIAETVASTSSGLILPPMDRGEGEWTTVYAKEGSDTHLIMAAFRELPLFGQKVVARLMRLIQTAKERKDYDPLLTMIAAEATERERDFYTNIVNHVLDEYFNEGAEGATL